MPETSQTTVQPTVATPCTQWEEMAPHWELIHDLLGGTLAMRRAAQKWLPKEEGESSKTYAARLSRSVLYSGFSDSLDKLSAKPFSKPVTIENAPDVLRAFYDNMDGAGTSATQFGRELFTAAATYGLTYVLIDFPVRPEGIVTLADERLLGLRPTASHIKPPDMIGWKSEIVGGHRVLTEIRFREDKIEPDGAYGDKKVCYVRVIRRDSWELWREESNTWVRVDNGAFTLQEIPLRVLYFKKTGYMTGTPPMEDLAWINLLHWQSMSDQRNILRFCRAALLFGHGFSEEDCNKGIPIGGDASMLVQSSDADIKYVEHSGAAITAGQKDIDTLEQRMEILGMQPFLESAKYQTATKAVIDSDSTDTEIQTWVQATADLLFDLGILAAKWLSVDKGLDAPDSDFGVSVYSDFQISVRDPAIMDFIYKMWMSALIEDDTLLSEAKRRGIFSDAFDPKTELERTAQKRKDQEMNNGKDNPNDPSQSVPPGSSNRARDLSGAVQEE